MYINKKHWIFAGVICLGIYLACFTFPKLIVQIHHPIIQLAKYIKGTNNGRTQQVHPNETIVSRASSDGLKITASFIKSKQARKNLILVHGIRSSKADFSSIASRMLDSGYNLLAVDLRAHGLSEGKYCTFGAKEKEDISMFVDFLKNENDLPIGIWGRSLGGAVALQALATDKRISFGIIESTFSSFDKICKDYFKRYAGFRLDWFVDFAIWRTGHLAQFNSDIERPKESCKRITQKILMVHGQDDKFISVDYGKENYESLASKQKEFVEIPNAGHANLWQAGGEQYFKKVFDFIH